MKLEKEKNWNCGLRFSDIQAIWDKGIHMAIIYDGDEKKIKFYIPDCCNSDHCNCDDWELEEVLE
jgi:hypothetical protein